MLGISDTKVGRFFPHRVVGAWNSLPEEVVETHTITMFYRHLDKHLNRHGIEGYDPNMSNWD